MSDPQSPTEAIRDLLFRKAEALNQQLLTRLTDTTSHLSKNQDLAVIGALPGWNQRSGACADSWCLSATVSRPQPKEES